jgi:hypothetical protein
MCLLPTIIKINLAGVFSSTLSEFENFALYKWILINVTTCQNETKANFKDFHRFGAFRGLVEQKNVVFNSFVYKLGSLWHSWSTHAKKRPIYTRTR